MRSWKAGWTPLVLFGLASAWTWPALVTPELLGRKPDALGTAWFIGAAPRLGRSLHDTLTGWPEGVTYGRPDSFVLLGLGWLLDGVDPVRLHALVQVLGVTLSAWAAEGFARAMGARAPWSLLAGVAFAFCGLASTALLEGYVYHVLDPWLPLLGWSWVRATSPDGRAWHGVVAGLCFLGALLTTAYLGVAAAVLVAGLAAGALVRQGRALRFGPTIAAALTVVGPLAMYLRAFLGAADPAGTDLAAAAPFHQQLMLNLTRLALPTPDTDLGGQHQSAAMPATMLALCLVAPVVLRRVNGWRAVAATGLTALALSLLPRIDPSAWSSWVPDSLRLAAQLLAASLLRFPDRIGWVWALCGGVVAARVATALAETAGRPALALLAFALADAFAGLRQPWRQEAAPAAAPSAYLVHEGPVLDFYPEDLDRAPAWTLRTTNTACFYQVRHRRPIADFCVFTRGSESPRVRLGRWVATRLFAGETDGVRDGLAELGFRTLAFHADYFERADRVRLGEALARIDPAPARSMDGGETLVAYAIPATEGEDPATAWRRWSP